MVDSPDLGNRDALERMLSQARTAVARENWPLAEDRLRRVRSAAPADATVARLLAQVLRETAQHAEAEAVLVEAFKAAPDDDWDGRRDLLLELADLRIALGRAAEAARALARVLAIEPNHWEALALLGDAYLDAGHIAEAARSYRESVSANPFEAETWWNLATALERAGDRAGAADALEGWLGTAPEAAEREQVRADIARLRAGVRPGSS